MKKRTIAVLAAAVVLLTACGSRSGRETVSEEMVAPEVSSEDLLVSSLEYLLEDDGTEAQPAEETERQEADAQGGAGEEPSVPEGENADADAGEEIVVYYGSGGSEELERETAAVEAVTPEEIVSVLARHNILSLDTKVLAFEQREEEGGLTLYLDLSKAAGEYLQTMSEEAESVIAAALIDTFLDNYGADAICLTVEGEPLVLFGREQEAPFVKCTPEELAERNAER